MPRLNLESIRTKFARPDAEDVVAPSHETDGPPPPPGALTEIYRPDEDEAAAPSDLGSMLVNRGVITPEQLTTATNVLRQSPGLRLVDVLLSMELDEAGVQECVAELAGLPFERLTHEGGRQPVDIALLEKLTPAYCKEHEVLPLRRDRDSLVLGSTRPDDVFMVDDVRRRLRMASVRLVVITRGDLVGAMDSLGENEVNDVDLDEILGDIDEDDVQVRSTSIDEVDLEKQAGESPVIRYVNYILQNAVREGASDIHIEPAESKLKVRFRIDGLLFDSLQPPKSMAAAITSRLKIMANLDISERRLPQDGRIRCTVQGRKLDLRMSTLPNAYGEKTVLRILDRRSINVGLDDLGFDESTLQIWKHHITQPHGIALVTGPTGSGKTTTLYASLRQMDKERLNISTVEDPIEYHLDGITQTQTHEKIGMSFAAALRSLLRQDPDVVLVGEIRDMETAHVGIQAALTGHLVLSTLHTNDAPSSITRMVNIGIEPFLVGAAVNAVLAQRLVRRICQHCREDFEATGALAEFVELNGMGGRPLTRGAGCDRCRNTGYSGRLGIYELLVIDDQLRDVIARNPNVSEFRRMCIERGMTTLRQDGLQKVSEGLTTIDEVRRVTDGTA